MNSHDISAFIMAGGKSRRFGEDKALYVYKGQTLIERVIDGVSPVIKDIAIIADCAGKYSFQNIPCYTDSISGMGPLGGILTALQRSKTERTFIFACDMPDLDQDLIYYMASISHESDATVPFINDMYEPLHAVYSKRCIAPIETCIQDGKRQIISFFEYVSVKTITLSEIQRFTDPARTFKNINYLNDVSTTTPCLRDKNYG